MWDAPLALVDLETTGGDPQRSRVIEIGVVLANGGELESEWSTLVNPGVPIPPSIQHFTGITDEMVRTAPFFEDLAAELLRRLEGRLFVAHNARFDYGFLSAELRRTGRRLHGRVVCTVKLSRRLAPNAPAHNLDALIERFALHCSRRHRALPDAQALYQLWQALAARHPRERLECALADVLRLRSVPAHLPPELLDELPEGPGVYRFFGEQGALLYVGKARDIRSRVLAHWQSAARDPKSQRLAELTRRVDWVETAGELGALLLEARLVREELPLLNRRLRGAAQIWTWVVADDGAAPLLAPLDQCPLSFEHSDCFGLYRGESAARQALAGIAREHRLCLKVLGLEQASGSCFAFQLGKCAGACVGAEPLRRHALRLKLALAPHRMKEWPFAGRIGIREAGDNGIVQLHVLDGWRHLGTLAEGDSLPGRSHPQPFDLEVYRILLRHLRDPHLAVIELPADLDAA
jgi:DNA polymerase-3 subunit epsilon